MSPHDKLIRTLNLEAFKKAESVYLDSPCLDGPMCYDEEYFWRAIQAYIEHANKESE